MMSDELKEKVVRVFRKCLRYPLTKYERVVLLSIQQGFSAWITRKLVGGSFLRYYKTRNLMKSFVLYKYVYYEYKKIIDEFIEDSLVGYDVKFFKRFIVFPIRNSYWYDKLFGYKKTNAYSKVKRMIAKLEEDLKKLKAVERKVCRIFLNYLIDIAFKGQFKKRRFKSKERQRKAELDINKVVRK